MSQPGAERILTVPELARSVQARDELLEARPSGWEFVYFAAVLLSGERDLGHLKRNHALALPMGDYKRIPGDEVVEYIGTEFGRLAWIVRPLERVFEAQADAFGLPGQEGDPELIEHFAMWVIDVRRRLFEWAGEMRSVGVPDPYTSVVEMFSHAADLCLAQIGEFIDATVDGIGSALTQLADRDEAEPVVVELTLTLEVDDALNEEAMDMLREAISVEGGDEADTQ